MAAKISITKDVSCEPSCSRCCNTIVYPHNVENIEGDPYSYTGCKVVRAWTNGLAYKLTTNANGSRYIEKFSSTRVLPKKEVVLACKEERDNGGDAT